MPNKGHSQHTVDCYLKLQHRLPPRLQTRGHVQRLQLKRPPRCQLGASLLYCMQIQLICVTQQHPLLLASGVARELPQHSPTCCCMICILTLCCTTQLLLRPPLLLPLLMMLQPLQLGL